MTIRFAVIPNYQEECWPSMNLVAEMLLSELPYATRLLPPYRRRAGSLPYFGSARFANNFDRLVNRHIYLPWYLRRRASEFDYFHVTDHSYAQVVHSLPRGRTGVYCHDLDAFRCLIEPHRESRPYWFRVMSKRILSGMQLADIVFYSTSSVRKQIERYGLVDSARLVHAPYGVSPEFRPTSDVMQPKSHPFLLHVGSCIPRKRIDVLLDVFASVRNRRPSLRLVKIGGTWSDETRQQINTLGIGDAIDHITNLDRGEVARYYQRASVVLLTSESEGFGLPIIEALACGAAVVVSDLPVLREVGGEAVDYCPVADVGAWTNTVTQLLDSPFCSRRYDKRIIQASRFTWQTHASIIAQAYQRLATCI